MEPKIKIHLEFLKVCLIIKTKWPKMPYNSDKNKKVIINVTKTPKTPMQHVNLLSFVIYLIQHVSQKEGILDGDHDQF